jgi:ATP-dependent RNA helicase DeaD
MYERFYEFGLKDEVLQSIQEMGFEEPTQIQRAALPHALKGQDIIGVAQTGTGKTAAFAIPIIEKDARGSSKHPAAIVLVPTRELAVQVAQEINRIGTRRGYTALPVYGGSSMERQVNALRKGVDVVVGTPGRVMDHMRRRTLLLGSVATVVLDEADEMLNMGFVEDITTILAETPPERQTLLFSATMPAAIVTISKRYMTSPKRVQMDAQAIVASGIKQIFYEVRDTDKAKALTRIIDVQNPGLTLVFCHTKMEVDDLSSRLKQMGYASGAIHGDFTQTHRDEMMRKFKTGEVDVLVATDVAARGLDIDDVTHVINYSIPQNPDAYVHRVGRTGRAGRTGVAITFVTPREYRHLKLIERTAKTTIEKGRLPTADVVRKARERDLIEAVEAVIETGGLEPFRHIVADLCTRHDPEVVMAASLSLMGGEMMDVEQIEEISSAPREFAPGPGGMRRLMLTIGRRDNVKVGDIVRTIAAKSKVPGKLIGKIALFDTYSFVEVPADVAEQVIASINDSMIEGRRVQVKSAKKEPGGAPAHRGKPADKDKRPTRKKPYGKR